MLNVANRVERIRLLRKQMISDVWKYFVVVTDICSVNNPFPMSILCRGFPTNLIHFGNVISRPNKIQRKYRQTSQVVGTPLCNENPDILRQNPWPAHDGQPSAGSPWPTVGSTRPTVGGPFRSGFPYPVGSDKLIRSIFSHRHIPSLSFICEPRKPGLCKMFMAWVKF